MKRKNKTVSMMIKLVMLGFALLLGFRFVYLQLQIGRLRTQSAELDREIAKKTTVNEELKKSLQAGNTDESIAKIARDVLGYASPGEKVYIDSSEQ